MSYTLDRAHIVPFANQIQHFRQRSSVSRIVGLEPTAQIRRSYDGRPSLDHLPPSPPLMAWDPDSPGSESPPPPKRPVLPQKKSTEGLLSTKLAERAPLVWRTRSRGGISKGKITLSLPAIAALATGGFLLVLYTILSADSSSDGFGLVPQLRSSLRNGPCDPYAAPGQLQVDLSDPDLNQWHPKDVSCQAPRFFQQLRSSNDRYQRGSIPHSDFDWVRGKTVLLIGDSVSREHVENFCQLMGEDAEVIRPTHKWAPAPAPLRGATRANPGGAAHSRRHAQQRSGPAAFRDAGRPRMCYIPRFDLLLVSVLHYGLDQQDYWELSRNPLYTAPGTFEHRISDVVRPLLANIRADGRPSAPDYIEFAPGTWDLARFAEEDAMLQRDTQTPLTPDRVAWFWHRVESASERIRAAFPSARTKSLRTMYYPLDQRSEVDYFMDKTATIKSNGTSVAYFAHERVNQLNEAMRSLTNEHPSYPASGKQYEAPGLGFSVNEFGRILKGHQPHQTDRLHGEPVPGGYVWADIMLYNLWKASQQ